MPDRYPIHLRITSFVGFAPMTLLKSLAGVPYFVRSIREYRRLNERGSFQISLRDLFPILSDRWESAGTVQGHYFHQDLWAARKVFQHSPPRHVDIGSRVDGFVAHVLAFMPVTVIDIREMQSTTSGLSFLREDATELKELPSDSIESISSLHAAEHFGLGRYSDPIDPDACFKFMRSLERVLAPKGSLYFSVPIGRERVEFNAHRVFDPNTVVQSFAKLQLASFAFVDDDGRLHEGQDPTTIPKLDYGCGLFHFTKPVDQRDAGRL